MSDFTIFYRFQAITDQFERSLSGVDNHFKKISASCKRIQESANSMGDSALSGFTKLSAGIVASAIPVYRFEKEMNKMVASSGQSYEAMNPLIDLTKELGATTEHSASAVMRASTNLMQAGFTQDQALKLLPQTLQLATAGYMEMGEASAMVSDSVKSFGLEADQSQRIVDVLAKGATMAKLQVSDFGEVIGKVGGIAQLQNQSFEKTIAQFMAIKDTGLDASTSATGLGSIMQRLSKPTKEAKDAFNALGIDINSMIAKGAQFDDIMLALSKHQLTTSQSARIFGIMQAKVGVALAQNYDKVVKYTAGLEASQGSAKKMQDTMNMGLVGALARFSSALEGLILQSGEKGLSGALTNLLDSVTAFINKLSTMGIQWDSIIKYTLLATAGLLGFGIAMKAVALGIAVFRGISLAITGITAVVGILNATLAVNPIVLFAVGATMAIYALWKYWDQIISAIKSGFDWAIEKFNKVKSFLGFDNKDNKVDVKKISEMNLDNKVKSESTNKIKVDNNATIGGKITVESLNDDFSATLNKLNIGYQ